MHLGANEFAGEEAGSSYDVRCVGALLLTRGIIVEEGFRRALLKLALSFLLGHGNFSNGRACTRSEHLGQDKTFRLYRLMMGLPHRVLVDNSAVFLR